MFPQVFFSVDVLPHPTGRACRQGLPAGYIINGATSKGGR